MKASILNILPKYLKGIGKVMENKIVLELGFIFLIMG